MTAPAWATQVPTDAAIHPSRSVTNFTPPFSQQQLEAIVAQLIEGVLQQVLVAITGVFLPGSSAGSQLFNWAQALGAGLQPFLDAFNSYLSGTPTTGSTVADFTSLLDQLPFIGPLLTQWTQLPAPLASNVAATSLTTTNPVNLLPQFGAANALSGQEIWNWDGTQSSGADTGSMHVPASGISQILWSIAVQADPTQKVTGAIDAMWSGLSGVGNLLMLLLQPFDNTNTPIGDPVVLNTIASPPTSSSWQTIAAATTTPAGTAYYRLGLQVTSHATAGDIWFSNPASTKTTQLASSHVAGLGGVSTDLGSDLQKLYDTVVSTINQAPVAGTGLPDVSSALASLASDVAGHGTLIDSLTGILGIRNNKPGHYGVDATTEATLPIIHLGSGSTPTNFTVTASASAIGLIRIDKATLKAVVAWHGAGTASVTTLVVNVYKMNTTTGDLSLMSAGANIVGSVGAGWGWNLYTLPTPINAQASDVYAIELQITGTGTHTVAGVSMPWLPNLGSYPKALGATRGAGAAPSTIAAASVGYSTNIPWFAFAMSAATIPATNMPPHTERYTAPGTYTVTLQPWCVEIDLVVCGGGANGTGGGAFYSDGNGGHAATWYTQTLVRGIDMPWDTTTLAVVVGSTGAASTVNAAGWTGGLTAPGATGTTGGTIGGTPGPVAYNGLTFYGGAGGIEDSNSNNGTPGAAPGAGGGAGGGSLFGFANGTGGLGAVGFAAVTQRQT